MTQPRLRCFARYICFIQVEVVDGAAFTESHIDVVYMFCGALLLAFSLGFLYVGAKNVYDHRRRLRKHREGGNTEPMKQDGAVDVVYSRKEKLVTTYSESSNESDWESFLFPRSLPSLRWPSCASSAGSSESSTSFPPSPSSASST